MQFWGTVTSLLPFQYPAHISNVFVIPCYCFWHKHLDIDKEGCLSVQESKRDEIN